MSAAESSSESGNRPGPLEWRAIRIMVTATMFGAMPSFLLASLAAQARSDLLFTEARLGAAMSAYHAVAALSSAPAGRLIERIGSVRGIALSSTIAACSLMAIGVYATSWVRLTAFLAVGGLGTALAHPSANLVLARTVKRGRQGLAFGIKQAAVPATTFVGGLAVPIVGLTIGWRWAFVAASVGAMIFLVYSVVYTPQELRILPSPHCHQRSSDSSTRGSLHMLAGAAVLGTAAGNALATFMVVAGINAGIAPGPAGLLLSAASFSGMSVRVLGGWLADRRQLSHLPMIAGMMLSATTAFLLMSWGRSALVLAIGAVVGFAASWGWSGLLMIAVVRRHPTQPAAATAIAQGGIGAGGVLGPISIGWVIENGSYPLAWLACAMLCIAAFLCIAGVWWQDGHRGVAATS